MAVGKVAGAKMTHLRTIQGQGATQDRAGALAQSIKDLCYKDGLGMSVAAIVGCLEIVKLEILGEVK